MLVSTVGSIVGLGGGGGDSGVLHVVVVVLVVERGGMHWGRTGR